MNISEIELFEIARLIKEEEKHFLEKIRKSLPNADEIKKNLEEIALFYARQEKQRKKEQKICHYVDNEETLAYLKENFATILTLREKASSPMERPQIKEFWLQNHIKVLEFFENLSSSTSDSHFRADVQLIQQKEKEWEKTLAEKI